MLTFMPAPTSERVHTRRWLSLAVLCLSLFIVVVDNTILNTALPTLQTELSATSTDLKWMVDAFTLMFASLMLIGGAIGDRFGRREALAIGMTIFGIGSVLAATWASTSNDVIVCRAIMGVGAALVMPATLSLITAIFPENERAKAIAIWSGVSGLAVAAGPITGGWLLEHFWWGSIFLVNVPIAIVAIVTGFWLLPFSRDEHHPRLDLRGAAMSVVALAALVFGIIEGAEYGWTDVRVLGAFAVALVVGAAFVAWQLRCDHPMIQMSLFRNMRFTAANISITFLFFALFGSTFFLTQYLQFVQDLSPLEAGVRLAPMALAILVISPMSARIAAAIGTKYTVAGGLALVVAGLLLTLRAENSADYGPVLLALVVLGIGMGLTISPATDAIMGTVPPDKAGIGAAMNDTTRELGGALGVAILGSVLSSSYRSTMESTVAADLPADASEIATDSIGGALRIAGDLGSDGAALADAARSSFVDAMHVSVTVAAGVALVGALVALVFLPNRSAAKTATPAASDDHILEVAAR
jgi:EmrB/QacA subfamily drug resistance transporter